MESFLNPAIEKYIRQLAPERPGFMREMEAWAQDNFVSIIPPEVAGLLWFLVRMKGAGRILEIGTAIAYSAIWLTMAAEPFDGRVTTLEINDRRAAEAMKNIHRAELTDKITLLKGHADDILPELPGGYDFIFVDAAKGQYSRMFEVLYPKLETAGLLVFDNVFSNGLVVLPEAEFERRQRTMVRRLREFLSMITTHPNLETTVIPMGDGLTVSLKK